MAYIDFNDKTIPIGKRKQSFVKWAVSKGTELAKAKKIANNKFGFEVKPGIFALVVDSGRMHQNSFEGIREIFEGYNLKKYSDYNYKVVDDWNNAIANALYEEYRAKGWDVVEVILIA